MDRLRDERKLTNNAVVLLKDIVYERDDAFFQLILTATISSSSSLLEGGGVTEEEDDGQCDNTNNVVPKLYNIQHLDDILHAKIGNELDELYKDCSRELARVASKQDRKQMDLLYQQQDDGNPTTTTTTSSSTSLTYGEITFSTFMTLLDSWNLPGRQGGLGGNSKKKTKTKFYDLGSGTGRCVFAARLSQDFDSCCGIELLPTLDALAKDVLSTTYKLRGYHEKLVYDHIELHCGNIIEYDWSDGDVIFVHGTCFDTQLMTTIVQQAQDLKSGSIMIVVTEASFPPDQFRCLHYDTYEMDWGEASVYIYQRR